MLATGGVINAALVNPQGRPPARSCRDRPALALALALALAPRHGARAPHATRPATRERDSHMNMVWEGEEGGLLLSVVSRKRGGSGDDPWGSKPC